MGTFRTFEEIEAWQKARELTQKIYRVSKRGAFARDYGLRDQVQRSCVSVMSNIAEGFERSGTGEFIQFLSIAKGSVGETRSHLCVAVDEGYIDDEQFRALSGLAREVSHMIAGLMQYLRDSKVKGAKYGTTVKLPTRN